MIKANAEAAATTTGAILFYFVAKKLGKDTIIKAAVTTIVAPLAPAAATVTIATVSFGSTAYTVFQAGKLATDMYIASTYTAQINDINQTILELRAEKLQLNADILTRSNNIRELNERKTKLLEKTKTLASVIDSLTKQNIKLEEQCEQLIHNITALSSEIENLTIAYNKKSVALNP